MELLSSTDCALEVTTSVNRVGKCPRCQSYGTCQCKDKGTY